jgi:hypothetical protein
MQDNCAQSASTHEAQLHPKLLSSAEQLHSLEESSPVSRGKVPGALDLPSGLLVPDLMTVDESDEVNTTQEHSGAGAAHLWRHGKAGAMMAAQCQVRRAKAAQQEDDSQVTQDGDLWRFAVNKNAAASKLHARMQMAGKVRERGCIGTCTYMLSSHGSSPLQR